jgi:hypothetical protein
LFLSFFIFSFIETTNIDGLLVREIGKTIYLTAEVKSNKSASSAATTITVVGEVGNSAAWVTSGCVAKRAYALPDIKHCWQKCFRFYRQCCYLHYLIEEHL